MKTSLQTGGIGTKNKDKGTFYGAFEKLNDAKAILPCENLLL
jgi:hypothetical protein